MTPSHRSVVRILLTGAVGALLTLGGVPAAHATAPSAPVFDYDRGGAYPMRVPTSGGTTLYLYEVSGVPAGATVTATFTPVTVTGLPANPITDRIDATPVSGVPVIEQPDLEDYSVYTLQAPAMPAGPVKITLINTVAGEDSAPSTTYRMVTYGDTTGDLSFTCTETSIALNADAGDYVRLVPTGACLDPIPYLGWAGWTGSGTAPPTYPADPSARWWGVGAIANISVPPARGDGYTYPWTLATHPLSSAGPVSESTVPADWAAAATTRGAWQPVVGSDGSGSSSGYAGGYRQFRNEPNGLVLQLNAGAAIGDQVGFVTFYAGDYQYASTVRQIPIVYAGGRITPPTPTPDPGPAPAPQESSTPVSTPTVAPVVIPTSAPAAEPVTLPAGSGGALINGVATPVTVETAPGGNAVVVSAGGASVQVGGLAPNGAPLPLAPDGSLIVAESGGVQMGGSGFSPGSSVSLYLYSTPTKLGELPVSATGSYSGSALIPAGVASGSHTIQAIGYTPSGATLALSVGVTVTSAAAIRGASPAVKAATGAKRPGDPFKVTATGVQSRCTVTFWTKGTTIRSKAGVAGVATATLTAPSTKGSWTVTAKVSGDGCEERLASTRILVR